MDGGGQVTQHKALRRGLFASSIGLVGSTQKETFLHLMACSVWSMQGTMSCMPMDGCTRGTCSQEGAQEGGLYFCVFR